MIGIDISSQSIKMVQLTGDRRRHLQAYCWHDMPPGAIARGLIQDDKAVGDAVMAALSKCRLPGNIRDTVVASIPEAESFMRVVSLPEMEESEIAEAVQWEVAQHIPFGLEKVYIDWQPIRSDTGLHPGLEVLVGVAEKRVVDPLYAILTGRGLDVAALELESQAIIRSLLSQELRQKSGLLIIDIGGTTTNIVVHEHGTTRFTASLQKGILHLTQTLNQEEKIIVASLTKEPPAAVAARITPKIHDLLSELVVEIKNSVEFYAGHASAHKLNEVLLTGGGTNLPGLDEIFSLNFDRVHVQRGNPWINILEPGRDAKPPLELRESVHYATALGLALRPELT